MSARSAPTGPIPLTCSATRTDSVTGKYADSRRNPVRVSARLVPAASDKYVKELDGIRAVAVGLVVAAHYQLLGPFHALVPGGFGVTLFFFLSGYLITTLFYSEYRYAGQISIPRFYSRRWLRLTPPLVISVILGVVFFPITRTFVGGSPVPTGTTMAALFYYTNYYDLAWGLNPFKVIPFGICWSLAVEEHFYLLWPWTLRGIIHRPRRPFFIIVGLCASVLVWRFVAREVLHVSENYTYFATDCRIDSILYGALLRVLFETEWADAAIRIMRTRLCQAIAALALLSTFVIRNELFRTTLRFSLEGLALMPFFTAVLTEDAHTFLRQSLASPPMVLIGKLSYSIYLFHLLAGTPGEVYFGSTHPMLAKASGLILTGLVSYGLYIFMERPIARIRRRLRTPERRVASSPTGFEELTGSAVIALRREPTTGG